MQCSQFLSSLVLILIFVSSTAIAHDIHSSTSLSSSVSKSGLAIEGHTYMFLNKPIKHIDGKLEVLEFFSYGCPHCYHFLEPFELWSQKRRDVVVVRRIPVSFGRTQWEMFGRLFYTIQIMKIPSLDAAAFSAIRQYGHVFYDDQRLLQWAVKQSGVDAKRLSEVYFSEEVANAVRKADELALMYQIDGVPAIVVGGNYRMLSQRGMNFNDLLANTDAVIRLAFQRK